ncbi:MAG: RdgB/HAM1 family non-canonical purine NTP pyrophosphatase [Pseudomonadota bacterium]
MIDAMTTTLINDKNSKWFNQKLVIASHNKGKVVEIRELLSPLGFSVSSAADYDLAEPEETEDTFEGNALLKARFVYKATQLSVLADDSGLVIPALGGDPGVYSARWAENGDFNVAMEKVQSRLLPDMDPAAYFVCVLAFVDVNGTEALFKGTCHGHIQFPQKGTFGFGYCPIFVPDGETRTFGEMPYSDKQKYSHRSRAFEQFQQFLLAS